MLGGRVRGRKGGRGLVPTNAQGRQLAGPSCIPAQQRRDLQPDYFFLAAFLVDFLVAFFAAFFLAAI